MPLYYKTKVTSILGGKQGGALPFEQRRAIHVNIQTLETMYACGAAEREASDNALEVHEAIAFFILNCLRAYAERDAQSMTGITKPAEF